MLLRQDRKDHCLEAVTAELPSILAELGITLSPDDLAVLNKIIADCIVAQYFTIARQISQSPRSPRDQSSEEFPPKIVFSPRNLLRREKKDHFFIVVPEACGNLVIHDISAVKLNSIANKLMSFLAKYSIDALDPVVEPEPEPKIETDNDFIRHFFKLSCCAR